MATGYLFYFCHSSGLLHRTSFHMWGRWYLPMFLFRDGLLTLIYRASFMVLMRFWFSLPIMLKLSMLTSWPDLFEWSCIGEGAFRCSLNLSANVLADSPMYTSSHSTLSHLYLYMTPLFSGCELYPLEPIGDFWWWVLLWNVQNFKRGLTESLKNISCSWLISRLTSWTDVFCFRTTESNKII